VALVRTEVSEESIAYIIWLEGISELGTTSAVNSNWSTLRSSLIPSTQIMEPIRSFETSVLARPTRRQIPEHGILHSHRRENLNS
jgi:hypothetical protein